ncbi:MAG: septal ring lytic transglycosylase RlpA family protein [Myxococcales bacterium]
MRRSLWLVAAAWWLLQLGACGDQPDAKTPHAVRSSRAARTPRARRERPDAPAVQRLEASENADESRSHARGAGDAGVTSEQLAQRYGRARALTVLQGSGSYYADKFAGRPTASGAPYEPNGFTAAHRTLPFGTVLRVTRLGGGQQVYVRVTDRGPYGPRGRILDLSRAAAAQLGMLRAGVAKLEVEVVEYGAQKPRRRKR